MTFQLKVLLSAVFTLLSLASFANTQRAVAEEGFAHLKLGKQEPVKIHYQLEGKGDDTLVFVHGWACNGTFWKGQQHAFPNMRVITLDLPGHGQSDKPKPDELNTYSMSYFAHAVNAVLKETKTKQAILIGHSMGTPVIRQFYRLYPEKTQALVIVDGALRAAPVVETYNLAAIEGEDALEIPKADPMESFTRQITHTIESESLKEKITTQMKQTPDYVGESAKKALEEEGLWAPDPINVPTLAIMAQETDWPEDTEMVYYGMVPNLDFQVWRHVSHFLMMEKPDAFNQALIGFMQQQHLLKQR